MAYFSALYSVHIVVYSRGFTEVDLYYTTLRERFAVVGDKQAALGVTPHQTREFSLVL